MSVTLSHEDGRALWYSHVNCREHEEPQLVGEARCRRSCPIFFVFLFFVFLVFSRKRWKLRYVNLKTYKPTWRFMVLINQ